MMKAETPIIEMNISKDIRQSWMNLSIKIAALDGIPIVYESLKQHILRVTGPCQCDFIPDVLTYRL